MSFPFTLLHVLFLNLFCSLSLFRLTHLCFLSIIYLKISMHMVFNLCCWQCFPFCLLHTSFLLCHFHHIPSHPAFHPCYLPSCFTLFLFLLLSLLLVTSFPLGPPVSPSPLVLSQLGCGLDGSGPPLPSPRLQQQHQPQIQVIQQL